MPITEHSSFDRPPVTARLWRYTDLPKFIDLLTSRTLWLANVEVLAAEDPHEGLTGAVQFAHRLWQGIDEVPELLKRQILEICGRESVSTPEAIFKSWVMGEEQRCIMTQAGRRDFYVSCWHAADHESVAMWKIYSAPGAGVAIVSNGGRLEAALAANDQNLHLGAVRYVDPGHFEIGTSNVFNTMTRKRASYEYEQEVRLVHWSTGEYHDLLQHFAWNEETLRFDNLVEDTRPLMQGIALDCDLDVMIERVIVSPFAPSWYAPTIERLREQLGFRFQVTASKLLAAPSVIP